MASGQIVERSAMRLPVQMRGSAGDGAARNSRASVASVAAAESPAAKALRLFDEMRRNGGGLNGGPPTELFEFLQALSGCDAATLETILNGIPGESGGSPVRRHDRELLTMVLARYANLKPEEAVNFATSEAKKSNFREVDLVLAMAFAGMAGDPARAQRLINSVPEGQARTAAEGAWLLTRAKNDPDTVLTELLAKGSSTETEQRVVAGLLSRKAAESPVETLAIISQLKPELRQESLGRAVGSWLETNPQAAGEWARQSRDPEAWLAVARFQSRGETQAQPPVIPLEEMRDRLETLDSTNSAAHAQLVDTIASGLAAQSPTETLKWAASLTGNARISAEIAAGTAWIQADPVAASEWLSSVPAGGSHDQLVNSLVDRIAPDDAEAAIRWAATIQSADIRRDAHQAILRRANANDPSVHQLRQSQPPDR